MYMYIHIHIRHIYLYVSTYLYIYICIYICIYKRFVCVTNNKINGLFAFIFRALPGRRDGTQSRVNPKSDQRSSPRTRSIRY